MPQINRIRVNNVKYNFGTQVYDDFVMRFSCRNTIYDLANGGGKSVLMLLLLQNLIPNCTLDDKQPIEKLFRTAGASTTIHSLIEWKLDSCDVKEGLRYMTTGFCARKGRDNGDEAKNTDAATIDYFNYCIFYREFGDNDIKNLPLVKNGERITYNGLKAYLRDLEKNDFGVRVYIFDRKSDYQNFICGYGLYESQWEIVRGINKTEGHVRTYFENSYKTTRKVVEDLLIEEIIEKSYNNRIRKNVRDDDEMARTLLDIKDKLVELSKRKNEIDNYNGQISVLESFAERLDGFEDLFVRKINIQQELRDCYLILRQQLSDTQQRLKALEKEGEALKEGGQNARRQAARAELEAEYRELEKLEGLIKDTMARAEAVKQEKDILTDRLKLAEIASEYEDYLDNSKKYQEIKALINSKDSRHEDILRELAGFARSKKIYVDQKRAEYEQELEVCKNNLTEKEKKIQENTGLVNSILGDISEKNGLLGELSQRLSDCDSRMDAIMSEHKIMFSENAYELMESAKESAVNSKKHIEELENSLEKARGQITEAEKKIALLKLKKENEDRNVMVLEKENEQLTELKNTAWKLKSIYGGDINAVEKVYDATLREKVLLEKECEELDKYMDAVKSRTFPEYNDKFIQLYNYLKSRYGESIESGRDMLSKMQDGGKTYLAAHPYAPYVIYANGAYDDIMHDAVVTGMWLDSYIIPVVRDTESNFEGAFFVGKNMDFLWDDAALNSEISKLEEEKAGLLNKISKIQDKCSVMRDDTALIKSFDLKACDEQAQSLEMARENIKKLAVLCESEEKDLETLKIQADSLKKALVSEKENLLLLEQDYKAYAELCNMCDEAKKLNDRIKQCRTESNSLKEHMEKASDALETLKTEAYELKARIANASDALEKILTAYGANFEPYYKEDAEIPDLTQDEIDAKASAYIAILLDRQGDIADKQRLLATYDSAMEKCVRTIKYKGMTLEKAVALYKENKLVNMDDAQKIRLKGMIASHEKKISGIQNELDAENAQKNRIEGSIEHGRVSYEKEYGEFVRMDSENPQGDILRYRQDVSLYQKKLLDNEKEIKNIENDHKDSLFAKKDMERILENAGIEIDENMVPAGAASRNYEELNKAYNSVLREEERNKNTFTAGLKELSEKLHKYNAHELAAEVSENIDIPKNSEDVAHIKYGLADTVKCICLERDRIEKSTADMEKIQDSFVDRCVQICQNIKTELDRLPKLSKITLDEQVIPIITLWIPYIKEELYKDRMCVYINETVAGADSFNETGDKLKYIRGRLSWKKLFSVIVTDMTAIKLCLYKREHIKDQSRYLKYEEAVGSTGQSQGIYIQFLIAIINYISNINAMGKDNAITGKTIFIDNPFGAAKDVYIWEPIFKMLATNHVQLIVPARGVTPAITAMFDVNYVLGQKLVAGKQQTVVTDYRSEVKTEEMDYEELEYEQASFDFL